ncbi:MAG: hypothetical protein R6X08_09290 [Desulfosalsimonadaceae bacterium]
MDYIEEVPDHQENPGRAGEETSQISLRIIDSDLSPASTPPPLKRETTVRKRKIVNKLNLCNFNKETIRLTFKHSKDQRLINFDVFPQICFGNNLVCLWQKTPDTRQLEDRYEFRYAVLTEEQAVITIHCDVRAFSKKGICLVLPEKSRQASSRKARRYHCEALSVQVVQNGIVFPGWLLDFSAHAIRVEIPPKESQAYQWLNTDNKINLLVVNENTTLFSGECSILKKEHLTGKKHLVLKPSAENIQRFRPKQYRSKRMLLSPKPDIRFSHPFTGKVVTLKALDISGSGLSVEDNEENSVLIPGIIIPELIINMANTFRFRCKAQTVYRRLYRQENGSSLVQCGIAFLDMPCDDHMRLLSLLHQAENKNLYICNNVDLDQLWQFFFEAGFIYPRKYKFIKDNREKIRKTYETLYTANSNISRHFTWQQEGAVQGHLSMLRFYEKTWLIHHLAALPSNRLRVGVEILNQIGSFTYDSHRLLSSHMDYLICYFRPENRFPRYFFGGVCKNINNPKACSIDSFAYTHYRNRKKPGASPPEGWDLGGTTHADLTELCSFYEQVSGGLMIDALDLQPDEEMARRHSLPNQYRKLNLKRQRKLYSLKQNKILKAVFMANISNFALNLSDLTSSVSIFVLDPEQLTPAILFSAVSLMAEEYEQKTLPILVFPLAYAESHSLSYERVYNLWSLNMEHTDAYFTYFNKLIKREKKSRRTGWGASENPR